MAVAIGDSSVVKVIDNTLSAGERRVRNDGPDGCKISKDPLVVASAGFALAANAEDTVWLAPGQALYAICTSGESASIEVL